MYLSVCDEIGDFPQYGRERTRDGEEEGEGRRDRCRTSAASNYYRMFANRIDLHRPDFSFPVYRWKWWTSCVQSDVCVCRFSWVTLGGLDLHQDGAKKRGGGYMLIPEDCRVDGGNRSMRELYV